MRQHALAATALGGTLILLLGFTSPLLSADLSTSTNASLVKRYHQAVAVDPGNLTVRYLLGVALLDSGETEQAMREFRIAYPAYRSSTEAHYNLAIAALRLNDLDSVPLYLERAEALGALDAPATYRIADLYFNLAIKSREAGREEDAIRAFDRVLELGPEHQEVYRQLGDLYAQQGQTAPAMENFKRYLETNPQDPVSRDYLFALEFNRAQEHLANEAFADAEAGFQAALAIQPDSPAVDYYLGYLAYRSGRPIEAIDRLDRALTDADNNLREAISPLLYNCSVTLQRTGHIRAALKALRPLADRADADLDQLLLTGTLLLEQGDHRAALGYLERAAALQPAVSGIVQNLISAERGAYREWMDEAERKLEAEDYPGAAVAVHEAAALQPEGKNLAILTQRLQSERAAAVASHLAKAEAELTAGALAEARAEFKTLQAIDPQAPAVIMLQERIASASREDLARRHAEAEQALDQGRWMTAASLYRDILDLTPDDPAAEEGLQRAEEKTAAEIAALLATGTTALDAGDLATAQRSYQKVLLLSPDSPEALSGLTTVESLLENRVAEALRNGRQELDRGRFDTARAWFEKAGAIVGNEGVKDEMALLEQAINREADALVREAETAAEQGDLARAEKLYDRALSIAPGHSQAITGRQSLRKEGDKTLISVLEKADAALSAGNLAEAMSAYRKALVLAPDNDRALSGLQQARHGAAALTKQELDSIRHKLDEGDLNAAEEMLADVLSRDPSHRSAQALRQRLEQLKQAGATPDDKQAIYLQGVALYTQGQYPEAIKAWETVLALDPDHAKARQNIVKTRSKLQQIEEFRGG